MPGYSHLHKDLCGVVEQVYQFLGEMSIVWELLGGGTAGGTAGGGLQGELRGDCRGEGRVGRWRGCWRILFASVERAGCGGAIVWDAHFGLTDLTGYRCDMYIGGDNLIGFC